MPASWCSGCHRPRQVAGSGGDRRQRDGDFVASSGRAFLPRGLEQGGRGHRPRDPARGFSLPGVAGPRCGPGRTDSSTTCARSMPPWRITPASSRTWWKPVRRRRPACAFGASIAARFRRAGYRARNCVGGRQFFHDGWLPDHRTLGSRRCRCREAAAWRGRRDAFRAVKRGQSVEKFKGCRADLRQVPANLLWFVGMAADGRTNRREGKQGEGSALRSRQRRSL